MEAAIRFRSERGATELAPGESDACDGGPERTRPPVPTAGQSHVVANDQEGMRTGSSRGARYLGGDDRRIDHDAPPVITGSEAEGDLVDVHEGPGVEAPDIVEHRSTEHQDRPVDPVDRNHGFWWWPDVVTDPTRSQKPTAHARLLADPDHRSDDSAPRLLGERAREPIDVGGGDLGVVGEHLDDVARSVQLTDAAIDCRGVAHVAFHPDRSGTIGNELGGRAARVDHNDGVAGAIEHPGNLLRQRRHPVPDDDHSDSMGSIAVLHRSDRTVPPDADRVSASGGPLADSRSDAQAATSVRDRASTFVDDDAAHPCHRPAPHHPPTERIRRRS